MANQRQLRNKTGANEVDIVEFRLGDQAFGINVSRVREFVPLQPELVTALPNTPPAVVGVFILRDRTIPLIDLNRHLQREERDSDRQQVVIVTDFNQRTHGFIVDGINKIHRLTWDKFEPLSDFLGEYDPQMLGSISVDDREVFILDLEHILNEISPDPAEMVALDGREAGQELLARRAGAKLILADDSSMVRAHLAKKLKSLGYIDVKFCKNGREALEAVKQRVGQAREDGAPLADRLTAVVTDFEMPAMDGLTLCQTIKTDLGLKDLPVIMFSSLMNDHMAKKCREAGADAHTVKPGMADLVEIMDAYLPAES